MDRTLNLLGIARKAGKLAVGANDVAFTVRMGIASLVLSASDASDGSTRRAKLNAEKYEVKYMPVPYTKFEFGNIAGRGSPGILAILDDGLACSFTEKLKSKQDQTHMETQEEMHI
ncbi:MAG: ribosomal L7Ae/L30e/S12e/Gadd45 family protein [Oscillospiraceae bacterium]|nr:ribosomal L7Ae/L30e/S12e/Gadd45 family protein [Oscillospiraceae bacterium]